MEYTLKFIWELPGKVFFPSAGTSHGFLNCFFFFLTFFQLRTQKIFLFKLVKSFVRLFSRITQTCPFSQILHTDLSKLSKSSQINKFLPQKMEVSASGLQHTLDHFSKHLFYLLDFSSTCVNCQECHVFCLFSPGRSKCSRCEELGLACFFKTSFESQFSSMSYRTTKSDDNLNEIQSQSSFF